MFAVPVAALGLLASIPLGVVLPAQVGNADPVAYFDESAIGLEDTPLLIDVIANDQDADSDPLFIDPASLRIESIVIGEGSPDAERGDLVLSVVDGTIEVLPPADFHGSFVGSYRVTDRAPGTPGAGFSATTTFEGAFAPVNDAPRLADVGSPTQPIIGREESRLTLASPLAGATDPEGDPVSLVAASLVNNELGVVTLSETVPGGIDFIPAINVTGPVQLTYTAADDSGAEASASIWVSLLNVNDAPRAEDTSIRLSSGDVSVLSIPSSDPDGDELTLVILTDPAKGRAEVLGDSIRYTASRQESGADSFIVAVADSGGLTAQSVVSVDIERKVVAVSSTTGCQALEATRGQTLTVTADACAEAADGAPLTVSSSDARSAAGGRLVVTNAGTLRYTAPSDFSGVDSFTFIADDGLGNTASVIASVDVTRWGSSYHGASGRDGEIVRTYAAVLDRAPDAGGFEFWRNTTAEEFSVQTLARQFLTSSEFIDRFGDQLRTATDRQWVELVYNRVFERRPDAGGAQFWEGQLRSGAIDRVDLIVWFAHSTEFKAITQTS